MSSKPTTRRITSRSKELVGETAFTRLAVIAFSCLLIVLYVAGAHLFFSANAQSRQDPAVFMPAINEDRDTLSRLSGGNELASVDPFGNQPNAVATTFTVTR